MLIETSKDPIPYQTALQQMEAYVAEIITNDAPDKLWLLEHPDTYTMGVSGNEAELLNQEVNLIKTNRGGKITYHGPGMRIAYFMCDLKRRKACDIKKYVYDLEEVVIRSLQSLGITAERREQRIGLWVINGKQEDKIAAIGVRARKWVCFHGFACNISPDLSKFNNIIPCGINDANYGVTSLEKLGIKLAFNEFDEILIQKFKEVFGA